MGVSGPSLLIESTDYMIWEIMICILQSGPQIYQQYMMQGFIQDLFLGEGNVNVAAAIVSVYVNTPYLGWSGGMSPQENF